MGKRGWPDGLIERGGYYSWRNPVDRREYGIGRDFRDAVAQALEANAKVAGVLDKRRLVDRLDGVSDRTFGAWMDRYEKILAERELAHNTRRSYRSMGKKVRAALGEDCILERIDTRKIAEAIDSESALRPQSAQIMRGFLVDVFRAACAAGWIAVNPVLVTEKPRVKVKRARLTLELFNQIYEASDCIWLRNAMRLALVTGQRREDVALARFADMRDDGWWCEQRKTKSRVILPNQLRLDVAGLSLPDVVRQCRATGVLSRHLIHHVQPYRNAPPGAAVHPDTVSHRFTATVTSLGIDFTPKTPPTFHEIRSLAERLYREQGGVSTQDLLGHKDARTTATYHDNRGAEWVRIQVSA